jgi:NADH pyrophosphatase NudC (nudix superfamily)
MGSIAVIQACVNFKRSTPICGNCKHEKRERDEDRNRTERTCGKHGFFVLMSATCTDHEYRQKGANHATPKS